MPVTRRQPRLHWYHRMIQVLLDVAEPGDTIVLDGDLWKYFKVRSQEFLIPDGVLIDSVEQALALRQELR